MAAARSNRQGRSRPRAPEAHPARFANRSRATTQRSRPTTSEVVRWRNAGRQEPTRERLIPTCGHRRQPVIDRRSPVAIGKRPVYARRPARAPEQFGRDLKEHSPGTGTGLGHGRVLRGRPGRRLRAKPARGQPERSARSAIGVRAPPLSTRRPGRDASRAYDPGGEARLPDGRFTAPSGAAEENRVT